MADKGELDRTTLVITESVYDALIPNLILVQPC